MTATRATSIDPTRRQLWRVAKGPLLVALLIVAVGVLITIVNGTERGLLDPRAPDAAGSRAVAELLRAQGVQVELVETAAEAAAAADAGSTVLITNPDLLVASQVDALRSTRADLVLIGPGPAGLANLAPEIDHSSETYVDVREPGCELPAAVAAGGADAGGHLYRPRPSAGSAVGCYPGGQGFALVQLTRAGQQVTVLGAAKPLTNAGLAQNGNAALALRLLGERPRLVWYRPSLADIPEKGKQSFFDLVPAGWRWGAAQLCIAVILLALWRARRLGPVVAEPLPVIVRSTETVEGRARLYRRAGARDRASEELRDATRRRLVPLLGLPRSASPAEVVAAIAARLGRASQEVGALLYGPTPADDAALVQLAASLHALEQETRRS